MPGEKTQMTQSALSKRATVIAIILGLLFALPMTELILHVTYNNSGITNGPWSTHPKAGSVDNSAIIRAAIARYAIGSNLIEEAIYWHAATDSEGKSLQSSQDYVVHFRDEPDVSEFWSLTLYDDEDRLAQNPAEHYSVSNRMPLVKNSDGSFDIVISQKSPGTGINWLSAPPKGRFTLLMRYYGASNDVLRNLETTQLPGIVLAPTKQEATQ